MIRVPAAKIIDGPVVNLTLARHGFRPAETGKRNLENGATMASWPARSRISRRPAVSSSTDKKHVIRRRIVHFNSACAWDQRPCQAVWRVPGISGQSGRTEEQLDPGAKLQGQRILLAAARRSFHHVQVKQRLLSVGNGRLAWNTRSSALPSGSTLVRAGDTINGTTITSGDKFRASVVKPGLSEYGIAARIPHPDADILGLLWIDDARSLQDQGCLRHASAGNPSHDAHAQPTYCNTLHGRHACTSTYR